MNSSEEKILFEKIKSNDEKAFEHLFHKYYSHLCLFASRILQDEISAEEIVQDFFVKLWEKRKQLTIETSVKSYLYRSIKNLCLNHIEHNSIKLRHAQTVLAKHDNHLSNEDGYTEVDLAKKIEESILSLPEKRREIFRLSREEGLKYREIAEKLNISIKTVEAQMVLAIKTLRDKLKHFRPTFLLFLSFCKK
ncbi:RNA polymerase sigma-70 factor [Draconibacterium sp.]|nr:RNA polymerase sigma-70 factor [Draconibacterium sp.]